MAGKEAVAPECTKVRLKRLYAGIVVFMTSTPPVAYVTAPPAPGTEKSGYPAESFL